MKRLAALSLTIVIFAIAAPAAAASLQTALLRPKDIPKTFKVQDPPICFDGKTAASLEEPKIKAAALKAGLNQVCETSYTSGINSLGSHVMSFAAQDGTKWGMQYVPSYAKRDLPTGWKTQKIPKIGDGSAAIVHTVMDGKKIVFMDAYVYWHKGSKVGWVVSTGDSLTVKALVALAKIQAGRM